MDKKDYELLSTTAKKYVVQEKKASRLQKALDAANQLIAELKAKIEALTKELAEHHSISSRLHAAQLEQENRELRGKLRRYDDTIERHGLRGLFAQRGKNMLRADR